MVFSSLIFLFVFLTANLIAYFAVSPEKRNKVLLIFSLVFYAWGGPRYLLLLAGETLVSWLFAIRIDEARAGYTKRSEKFYLVCDLVIMLGCLAIFKYLGFFLGNIKAVFGVPKTVPGIALPIGISFYTFQLISYVVDVYRNEVRPQREYWKLLLYSSLFHQCIAGPIVRYETVADQIDNRERYIHGTEKIFSRTGKEGDTGQFLCQHSRYPAPGGSSEPQGSDDTWNVDWNDSVYASDIP